MALIPIENKRGGSAMAKNLYLYKDGVQNVALGKDGFSTSSGTLYNATYGTNKISVTGISNGIVFVGTINSVDLTNYANVHIKIKISQYSNGYGPKFAIFDRKSGFGPNDTKIAEINTTSTIGTDWVDLSLDVSGFSGVGYVTVSAWWTLTNFEVSEIYLEPYPTRLSDGELYAYGLGINDWDNGIYKPNTSYSYAKAWTTEKRDLTYSTNSTSQAVTLVTKQSINLSSYTRVNVAYTLDNGAMTTYSLDVSSVSSGYVILSVNNYQGERNLNIYTSNVNANFESAYTKYANIASKNNADQNLKVYRIWLS